jgi:hypothetical protein
MNDLADKHEPPPLPQKTKAVASVWVHALIGALVVGGISFAAGFFGPMIFSPQSNQGPMLGIFITGPAGFVVGLIGGGIVGIFRKGRDAGTLSVAAFFGALAVLSCGIPFVPPLPIVAVPLAVVACVIAIRSLLKPATWTLWRVVSVVVSLLPAAFALYLALGRHHLIDWLEGH